MHCCAQYGDAVPIVYWAAATALPWDAYSWLLTLEVQNGLSTAMTKSNSSSKHVLQHQVKCLEEHWMIKALLMVWCHYLCMHRINLWGKPWNLDQNLSSSVLQAGIKTWAQPNCSACYWTVPKCKVLRQFLGVGIQDFRLPNKQKIASLTKIANRIQVCRTCTGLELQYRGGMVATEWPASKLHV